MRISLNEIKTRAQAFSARWADATDEASQAKLVVEQKSLGKNLVAAIEQGFGYLHGLKEHELPQLLVKRVNQTQRNLSKKI